MIETRFKDTEIGKIPEEWEVKDIGEICQIVGGGTPSTDNPKFWNGQIQWFTPAELSDNIKFASKSERTISEAGLNNSSAKLLPKGTILLTTRATIGIASILLNSAATNQGFQSLIVKPNNDVEYIYYLVHTLRKEMERRASGSTFKEISPSNLSSIQCAIPPYKEQRRIAKSLSNVDALIAAVEKKIEKKKLIKQGAMQQLLTGKKRLPGYEGEWVEKRLGDLLEYEQPIKYIVKSTDYDENGIPVLTAGKSFILGYTNEETGIYSNLPVILFDDFLTCSRYIDFKFKVKSSAVKMLYLKDSRYNLRLIYELMQTIDFPALDHQRYWINQFSKLKVLLPSDPSEQRAIASILSNMDSEITALERKRDKLKELKQGMMQQLLTGKIRLVRCSG